MNKRLATSLAAALLSGASAFADTVLFAEDFDNDFSENFPYFYDGDSKEPASAIRSLFLSSSHGYYMPWWVLRESNSSSDRFLGSHSYYSTPGQSDDWIVSRAITIPHEGFVLDFDAQSVTLREGERLSDLLLFVSERQVTDEWRPSVSDAMFAQVPAGATPDVTTDEWTHYAVPLDKWAGKTVYLCFVNQNNDKDLLCIDNVKVSCQDKVDVTLEEVPTYITDAQTTLTATVKAVKADVPDYTVVFSDGKMTMEQAGGTLAMGGQKEFKAVFDVEPCKKTDFTVTVKIKGEPDVVQTASTQRLAFKTNHRVLIEETTGLWCGNCPLGMYAIESLKEDSNISDNVIPVSVHTSGGGNDMMVMDDYADFLGLKSAAPIARIDRGAKEVGFSTAYDVNYNPSSMLSFAYRIYWQREQIVLFDVDVEAEPVVEGTDTVAFDCVARVRPALDLDPQRYRVGFVLTENNVGLDGSPYWVQHNYYSGYPFPSKLGGWTELPDTVHDMRFHYVARAMLYPTGMPGSFSELVAGKEYEVRAKVDIPYVYRTDSKGRVINPAVRPNMCELTAYVVDTSDLSIQNCARVSVTPDAVKLFTVGQMVDAVEGVKADQRLDGATYDMQGRRVAASSVRSGLYIHNGRKVVVKQR